MIRVLDGKVRAFLSDRYRRLDNFELCAAVLPVIQEMQGAQIESCEVTPTHLYLKIVNRRVKAEVKVGDVVDYGQESGEKIREKRNILLQNWNSFYD